MSAPIIPSHPGETVRKDTSKWTFLFFGLASGTAIGMIFVLSAWAWPFSSNEPSSTAQDVPTMRPTAYKTIDAPTPWGSMCHMGERMIEQVGDTICVKNKLYAEIENKAQALLAKKLHAGQRDAQKWADRQDLKPNSIDGLWKYLCSAKPTHNGRWYASSQLKADYTFDHTFGLDLELQGFYMTLEVPDEKLTASEVCPSYPDWLLKMQRPTIPPPGATMAPQPTRSTEPMKVPEPTQSARPSPSASSEPSEVNGPA